jgi:Holliday junction resolvase
MFHTSTPVVGDEFHNRAAELALVARSMEKLSAGAPQWVAIIGPRKIGKTSLVLEAARRTRSPSLQVVVLDVQEQGPASTEVFRRLVLRILDTVFAAEIGESLERLMHAPTQYRAALLRSERFGGLSSALRSELLEIPEGRVTDERIHSWLEAPERLAEALRLWLVIALDEFQDLAALSPKDFALFARLRSVWQRHRRITYFISGSARSMLLALVTKEASPFFQHFSILELGPFSRDAAVELLRRPGPGSDPIPADLAGKAVTAIGGNPFYLQLLGETLTAATDVPNESELKAAFQALLFSPTGRLALFFDNEFHRIVGRSTFLAATLDALAAGPTSLTDVASRIRTSTAATAGYLERLKDAVARTEEGLYRLTDPTFGLWLRWRRPGGAVVPMSVIGDEAEQAVARELSATGFDLVYQSRASRGAFDLLATRGATQLGIQVKRSSLPLRFTKSEWSRMTAEAARLNWRWVVAAVHQDGVISVMDPRKAKRGREVRLDASATIDNLLRWVDGRTRGK